ncbi:MAG: hypothetical protein IPL19_27645 [Sandaracinaceae bacterium]|nr:hypothetical protein [Sandaracinaceae bacterium]
MKPAVVWLVCGLVLGCGGSRGTSGAATATDTPAFEIHEWGVITTSSAGTVVSAGPPGAPVPLMAVEKPVLYLHASAPLAVQLEVLVGAGFSVPEHYPPSNNMHWSVQATPGACPERHAYPSACASPDGVCEVPELPRYETTDAACLRVGEHQLPLLFYRLGATGHITLPTEVRVHGSEVSARATRDGVSGWRVAVVDGEVRAVPVTLGQAWHLLPTPSQPWTDAAAALNTALRDSGLTDEERAAFQRAWWQELFDAPPPSRVTDDPLEEQAEDQVAEIPEEAERWRRTEPVLDVLIYMMTPDEIDRVARIIATPTPNAISRAFLVRHVL